MKHMKASGLPAAGLFSWLASRLPTCPPPEDVAVEKGGKPEEAPVPEWSAFQAIAEPLYPIVSTQFQTEAVAQFSWDCPEVARKGAAVAGGRIDDRAASGAAPPQ
ncbi:MAG: hypothetical protein QM636_01670 [Rhizobium sp.]